MTVKLNLTIDGNVAQRIKSYAKRKKTSVSKIVEKQMQEVLNSEKKDKSFRKFIDKYGGSISRKTPLDIDKERGNYLKEKYGT